jgi:WD40 repeat protein
MADWRAGDFDTADSPPERAVRELDIDASGSWLAYSRTGAVYLRSLEDWSQPPLQLGEHDENVVEIAFHPGGKRIAAQDESGELRIWSTVGRPTEPLRSFQAEGYYQIRFGPSGRWLAAHGVVDGFSTVRLWDLAAPQGADPLTLRRDALFANYITFHSSKPWLVTSNIQSAGFWPLSNRYPWVLRGHEDSVEDLAFTPDGEWLVSSARDGVRAWPLRGQGEGASRVLLDRPLTTFPTLAIHPSGRHLAVASREGTVLIVPMAEGPVRELPGSWTGVGGMNVVFSPGGRLLAAVPYYGPAEEMVIRVWDLESGSLRTLGPVPASMNYLGFDDDRRLRWSGYGNNKNPGGERIFDLETGSFEVVAEEGWAENRIVSREGSFSLSVEFPSDPSECHLIWRSLVTGESRRIRSHGNCAYTLGLDDSDRWMVTGGFRDGTVRVGPVSGEEPFIHFGHQGMVRAVALSLDGLWVASGGDDGPVRLWPMPDLSMPPLHTLSLGELLATLHSLTNLRVVEDLDSGTGWKVETGPFPGWEEVPEW